MLALYHFGPVANSLAPLLCLIEKGLDFEDRFLNSRRWDHHTPEFRAINPRGMVPVLIHDGRIVTESTVINEYLEDAFPGIPALRPNNPWDRARMRIWTKYVDEHFCPALTVLGAHGARAFVSKLDRADLAKRIATMPDAEVRRKWETIASSGFSEAQLADARDKLRQAAFRMEQGLEHGSHWILGESYSLADIKLFSMAQGLERLLPDVCKAASTPRLDAWLRRMEARPAVDAMRAREYAR